MPTVQEVSRATRARRGREREDLAQQLRQIEWLARAFFAVVLGFVVLYCAGEAHRVASWSLLIFDLGVLLGVVVASAAVGSLLGFLFGIPRSLQNAGSKSGNGEQVALVSGATVALAGPGGRAFAGNTNLEEISDWLTKIIVGVGLVQAKQIYGMTVGLAASFAAAVPESQGASAMFVLVLIASLIGGFQFQYLETRTRIVWLLTDSEAAMTYAAMPDDSLLEKVLQTPIGVGSNLAVAPALSEDEEILKMPYESLETGDQLAAWGTAQARAGNLQAANQALRAAIAKDPSRKDFLVRLADVLEHQNSPDIAEALIREARQKGGDDLALEKRELVRSLYEPAPQGFQRAIELSDRLKGRPDGARDPFIFVWRAAAEGQRYNWARMMEDAETMKDARAQALAAAKRARELAPDLQSPARVLLQNMLDTSRSGASPTDDDLEVFRDDPDFRAVIDS